MTEFTQFSTLLQLSGIGITPYSARGLKQQLEPINGQSNIKRDINGNLMDLGADQFKKYRMVISGQDVDPPMCDGIWAGQLVTVDSIQEFAYPISQTTSPSREVVPGSVRTDADGNTFYRPRFTMMVTKAYGMNEDEWGRSVTWSLELEEV